MLMNLMNQQLLLLPIITSKLLSRSSQWDEPTLSGINPQIQGGTSIQFVRLDDSIRNKVFNVTLEEMNEFFLGGKNDIAKNYGTASHNSHIIFRIKGCLEITILINLKIDLHSIS